MVSKSTRREIQNSPPPLDEAWWAALLSEEQETVSPKRSLSPPKRRSKKERQSICVNWEQARGIYERDETVILKVTGYNRGGLLVDGADLQGFVPLSHLVELPAEVKKEELESLLAQYVGRSLVLKVIECDPKRGRVVLSERAGMADPGARNRLFQSLHSAQRVWGTVTNITDFGVFVDLGGVEGLIHVSELSWGRVRHPSEVVRLGERIEVFVISVDEEQGRIALSLKRLRPNPWETAEERYRVGQIIEVEITGVVSFGAFARLEEGLDGLIHASQMGKPGENIKPMQILQEGQRVRARILHIDAAHQRLGLSLRLDEI